MFVPGDSLGDNIGSVLYFFRFSDLVASHVAPICFYHFGERIHLNFGTVRSFRCTIQTCF